MPLPGELIEEAWQKSDQRLESDVGDYWQENDILPEGTSIEARLEQLVAVAHVGAELAGMTTAVIVKYSPLRTKFVYLRIMVLPEFRLNYLQIRLSIESKRIMAAYAKRNLSQGISGMMTVRQADYQATRKTAPRTPATQSTLIGYTKRNEQRRINWFDHVRM